MKKIIIFATYNNQIIITMKLALAIILPFIVYFGLGWVANYIYFAINPIISTTTMQEIYNGEILSTSFLCFLYCTIWEMTVGKDNFFLSFGAPILLSLIFVVILPMSVGASVVYSILNIGVMIAAGVISINE